MEVFGGTNGIFMTIILGLLVGFIAKILKPGKDPGGFIITILIGIAGWGGMEAASILPRRLTTTVVPTTAIGKAAAEALVARLKGEPGQEVTVVPTRLVPGETG